MNRYKFSLIPILTIVTTCTSSCQRYTIELNKKKAEEPQKNVIAESSKLLVDIRSFKTPQDYLRHLNELKSEGVGTFFRLYKEKGRAYMRQGLRYFRDGVLGQDTPEAIREDRDGPDCQSFHPELAFDIGGYGDIRQLLDTAFLITLDQNQTQDFNPKLPGKLDELYQLVFFEFGINMEGTSNYEKTATGSKMTSEVKWKIVHEEGDAEDLRARDELETQLKFSLAQEAGSSDAFELEARVLEGGAGDNEPNPSLALEYQIADQPNGRVSQILTITQGRRWADGEWEEKSLSRRVVLLVDLREKTWVLREHQRFGLIGEASRTLTRGQDQMEYCQLEPTKLAPEMWPEKASPRFVH